MTETLRFYRKPEVTIQQSRINFLGFLLPPFNLICNLTRKGKIDESIRVVGSVHRYSDYHNRIVTQREGEDVSRRRFCSSSRSFAMFPQVSRDRETECGRRTGTLNARAAQFPLSSSSAEITHVRHVVKRLYILASGPSTSSRSFYSTAPRLSLFLYYTQLYNIYTTDIYIYITYS